MQSATHQLLIDAWRRGRAYFLLASPFSLLMFLAIATEGELPIVLAALVLFLWMSLPQFLLMRIYPILRLLPISAQSIGRTLWWCTCGACAISTTLLFGFSAVVAYVFDAPFTMLGEVVLWIFAIAGISGHSMMLVWFQAAVAKIHLAPKGSWRERSVHLVPVLYGGLIVTIVMLGESSTMATWVLALSGYVVAGLSYRNSVYLAYALLAPKLKTKRVNDVTTLRPRPTAIRMISHLREKSQRWSPVAITILFFVTLVHIKHPSFAAIQTVALSVSACMFAASVLTSGFFFTWSRMASLCALRALPVSGARLSRMLLVRAVTPVLAMGAIATIANQFIIVAPTPTILALTGYLASFQTLWPALAVNLIAGSSTKRVTLVLVAFLIAAGGSIAVFAGVHWLAWIGGPLLGISGYLWTRKIIYTSSLAYRAPLRDARSLLNIQLDRWA